MKPAQRPIGRNTEAVVSATGGPAIAAGLRKRFGLLTSMTKAATTATITAQPIAFASSTEASAAPAKVPATSGTERIRPWRHSTTPARWKVSNAAIPPARSGRRLVPFATVAGRPIRIISGSVTADPLLASVLMKPERRPATTITTISASGLTGGFSFAGQMGAAQENGETPV